MSLRKNIWQMLWRESVRKLALGIIVVVLGTVFAFKRTATFAEYGNFLEWWLGIMVVVHVVDKKVKDQATSTNEQTDSSPPKS